MDGSLLLWGLAGGYFIWSIIQSVRRGRVYRQHRKDMNGVLTDIECLFRQTRGDK